MWSWEEVITQDQHFGGTSRKWVNRKTGEESSLHPAISTARAKSIDQEIQARASHSALGYHAVPR